MRKARFTECQLMAAIKTVESGQTVKRYLPGGWYF